MNKPIFHSEQAVTLIGAGGASGATLRRALDLAPRIVAADGGADVALAHGLVPEAVIGDLDSLSARAREALGPERIHRIPEQDSTDFDKALRSIAAPLVIGVGFEGDRLDHLLACFNTLLRRPERRCLLLTADQVVFLCPARAHLELEPGTLVSLFPMAEVRGRSSGLEWPIEGLNFAPYGRVGTSNRAVGAVDLRMDAPRMMVILPLAALEAAVRAVLTGDGWPAL